MRKRLNGLSRTQIRKLSDAMFVDPLKLKSPSCDISSYILANSNLYIAIANYIINFRMAQWHSLNSSKFIQNTFLPGFLSRVKIIGEQELQLSSDIINRLEKRVIQLVNTITADEEVNTKWGSQYLVSLYCDLTKTIRKINFYLHESPFSELENLNIRVFTHNNPIHRYRGRSNMPEKKAQLYKQLEKNRQEFFEHMPEECDYSNHYNHRAIQISLVCFVLAFCIESLGHYYKFPLLTRTVSGFLGLVLSLFIYFLNGFVNYLGADVGYLRTPFGFHQMSEKLKCGILMEIGEELDGNAEEMKPSTEEDKLADKKISKKEFIKSKPAPPPQGTQQSLTASYSSNHVSISDFSWKKAKRKKSKPGEPESVEKKSCTTTLLKNARLGQPLVITWNTQEFGPIIAVVGKSTKNIYPLWSGNPSINAFCQYCYLYYPIEKLQNEEDHDILDRCTKIVEIGHVIPPTGHVGVVSEDNNFKIKMLGKYGKWRHYFLPLKYQQGLITEAPRVEDHQYQLFTPTVLLKTH